jgi:hypothetical protein
VVVVVPAPAAPAPPALPAAIFGVHVRLVTKTHSGKSSVTLGGARVRVPTEHRTFTLDLTFSVRRKTMLGLQAFDAGRVIANTGLRTFNPRHGEFALTLTRDNWPTRLAFLTDAPTVTLARLASPLSGTITLSASAQAIKGRSISSVRFDYSPSGKGTWTPIGTATGVPYTVTFDTTTLASGTYDIRAVATDSRSSEGVSQLPRLRVQNAGK